MPGAPEEPCGLGRSQGEGQEPASLTIAVVSVGDPLNPETWSGTPAGLIEGLRAYGVEVLAADVRPPCSIIEYALRVLARLTRHGAAGRNWMMWRDTALYGDLTTFTARARCRRFNRADIVIQIGSQYRVPHSHVFTLEDMTLVQARGAGFGNWAQHSDRVVSARLRRHQRTYREVDGLLAATEWAAASMREDFGVPAEKINVIGLGGRCRETSRAAADAATRKNWEAPCFLFVGHDWERKNGPLLVRAFRRVRTELPEARLVLVGEHPRVEAPGIEDYGPLVLSDPAAQEFLSTLFARATCLVVPSRIEPAGLVYAEAGQVGVPSIGSDAGGAREMIGPGGIIVPADDEYALAEAMRTLADPATARRLGALAREHAATLTWEQVAARVLRIIAPENDISQ